MMLKNLILLVVIVAVAAFAYPLVGEGTTSSCDALERVTVRVVSTAVGWPLETGVGMNHVSASVSHSRRNQ